MDLYAEDRIILPRIKNAHLADHVTYNGQPKLLVEVFRATVNIAVRTNHWLTIRHSINLPEPLR
jgi:hypothetical protein